MAGKTKVDKKGFQNRVLGIDTTAAVVLATKKISLAEVLSLTSGTMLPFEKGCDEPITLEIGKQKIAAGEAVKVGDKFGMRVREVMTKTSEEP